MKEREDISYGGSPTMRGRLGLALALLMCLVQITLELPFRILLVFFFFALFLSFPKIIGHYTVRPEIEEFCSTVREGDRADDVLGRGEDAGFNVYDRREIMTEKGYAVCRERYGNQEYANAACLEPGTRLDGYHSSAAVSKMEHLYYSRCFLEISDDGRIISHRTIHDPFVGMF